MQAMTGICSKARVFTPGSFESLSQGDWGGREAAVLLWLLIFGHVVLLLIALVNDCRRKRRGFVPGVLVYQKAGRHREGCHKVVDDVEVLFHRVGAALHEILVKKRYRDIEAHLVKRVGIVVTASRHELLPQELASIRKVAKENLKDLRLAAMPGTQDFEDVGLTVDDVKEGLEVRVSEDFTTAGCENFVLLREGDLGTVKQLDADGDAFIAFEKYMAGQWVLQSSFGKMSAKKEKSHPAEKADRASELAQLGEDGGFREQSCESGPSAVAEGDSVVEPELPQSQFKSRVRGLHEVHKEAVANLDHAAVLLLSHRVSAWTRFVTLMCALHPWAVAVMHSNFAPSAFFALLRGATDFGGLMVCTWWLLIVGEVSIDSPPGCETERNVWRVFMQIVVALVSTLLSGIPVLFLKRFGIGGRMIDSKLMEDNAPWRMLDCKQLCAFLLALSYASFSVLFVVNFIANVSGAATAAWTLMALVQVVKTYFFMPCIAALAYTAVLEACIGRPDVLARALHHSYNTNQTQASSSYVPKKELHDKGPNLNPREAETPPASEMSTLDEELTPRGLDGTPKPFGSFRLPPPNWV